jgi:DNA-binding response OmpR family regulator
MEKTLLIVEDDEKISLLLDFFLNREGYKVTKVEDGKKALAWITSESPSDVVLLDLMLPFKDGYQILSEIRSHDSWKNVPVIILTAKAQSQEIARALDMGANDYLVKPFQPAELLARIKRLTRDERK